MIYVFRYFDYPDIFPNLLSALNLMLAVKTRLTKVKITKRFQTEPPLKFPVEAIISAKHLFVAYTCTFVDNLPLTNIL